MAIANVTDSLSALGEHGFFVAQYVVGRYKSSRITKEVFDISVSRLDPRLVGNPILFRVSDTLTYQLSYNLDGSSADLVGEFDKFLEDDLLRIMVARPANSDGGSFRSMLRHFAYTDIELRVHEY